MLIFVPMRRDQVGAVLRTVDRNFPLRAAANGADLLALRWTESLRFAFFTDRTGHRGSQRHKCKPAEYSGTREKTKRLKNKTPAHHGLIAGMYRHGISRTRRKIRSRNGRKPAGAIH